MTTVFSATSGGTILSGVSDYLVVFSNRVTQLSSSHTGHADYARLWMDAAVPTVVSRSTNEVWTWSVSRIGGHTLPSPVVVATNGPSVAYSILDAPVAPCTDDSIANQNVWASALDFAITTNACHGVDSTTEALAQLTRHLFQNCAFSSVILTYGNPTNCAPMTFLLRPE